MLLHALGFVLGMLSLLLVEGINQSIFLITLTLGLIFLNFRIKKWSTFIHWCLVGCCWANINILFWSTYSSQLILQPQTVVLQGVVCSIPVKKQNNFRFDLCLTHINQTKIAVLQRNKLRAYWGKYAIQSEHLLQAGQLWQFEAKLKPIHGRVNSGMFDYEKWLVAESYAGTATIKNKANLISSGDTQSFYYSFRQSIYNHLQQRLPKSEYQALFLAIIMGEKNGISDSQWEVFQQSGTSHLLAISGLHIGIAAMWTYWLVWLLWKCSAYLCLIIPAQKAAEISSLIGAVALVIVSGLALPAVRACFMLIIYLCSRWSGRYYSLANIISITLIITLIFQPFAILSTSFWLSFSAVAIIALVINRQVIADSKIVSWLKVNWYLYLFLIPVSWIFFGKVSWISMISNVILIPFYSFLLTPLIYFSVLISTVSHYLAESLFILANELINLSFSLQSFLAKGNYLVSLITIDYTFIIFFLSIFILLLIPKKLFSLSLLLPLSFIWLIQFDEKKTVTKSFAMWVFDVGQGLAIYVETNEGNLLFDTAWGNSKHNIAASTIIPFLQNKGVSVLNKVIISHADTDHSGGFHEIKQHFQLQSVFSGEPITNISSESCHQISDWKWSGIKFSFLTHLPTEQLRGNNASCVLSIETENHKLLLTGDIEKTAENALIRQGVGRHDLLVAPHHGSETSSTLPFVKLIKPTHVIFSAGYANRWHFPRETVVNRYRSVGSKIWQTARDGAIIITENKQKELNVSSFRQQQKKFWR